MKKYYMAFVDFSEIATITADAEVTKAAKANLLENGFYTAKGKVKHSVISSFVKMLMPSFAEKLKKRIRRYQGGIECVRDTFKKFCDAEEYSAFYLYLIFMYGFIEWSVPEKIIWFAADPDVLKVFANETFKAFDKYVTSNPTETTEETI